MTDLGFRFRCAAFAALLPCVWTQVLAAADGPPSFKKDIQPLLAKYCYQCHGADDPQGELDLSKFQGDRKAEEAVQLWEAVLGRINSFEMPPEGSPQFNDQERVRLARWYDSLPKPDNCNQLATDQTQRFYRGYVMSRRLNRSEYNNSVRDLLGVDLKPADSFPADGAGGEGFDTSGDALFTSAILMEKYLEAADQALSKVLPSDAEAKLPPELEAARQRLLIAQPGDQLPPREAARKIVAEFTHRAFRRPVPDDEVEHLLTMFDRAHERGDSFVDSLRLSLTAVLISPHFLFLVEPEPEKDGIYRLGHYQLASRLSYFIWASIPDAELLRLAAEEKLYDAEVLKQQVRRMLKDPKSRALGETFGVQWLGISALGGSVKPDAERFPEFDSALASAMHDEAVLFVHSVFQQDRSLLDLLSSDYTFVNDRLASHYGISGITGSEMRQVQLQDRNRGGVMSLASVLAATSYPLRTSPVLRGRWVLEEVLGSRVPPPPPGVPPLEEAEKSEGLTFRQQFELHRKDPACAACHSRMDPLGFGLENFDPIGRWRTEDRGQPLDTSGKLPSGEQFSTPAELKQVLLKRKGEFLRNFSKKLLGFALGRELNKFDQCVIDDSLKLLKENDYRASLLVEQIVLSYPFQHRYVRK